MKQTIGFISVILAVNHLSAGLLACASAQETASTGSQIQIKNRYESERQFTAEKDALISANLLFCVFTRTKAYVGVVDTPIEATASEIKFHQLQGSSVINAEPLTRSLPIDGFGTLVAGPIDGFEVGNNVKPPRIDHSSYQRCRGKIVALFSNHAALIENPVDDYVFYDVCGLDEIQSLVIQKR